MFSLISVVVFSFLFRFVRKNPNNLMAISFLHSICLFVLNICRYRRNFEFDFKCSVDNNSLCMEGIICLSFIVFISLLKTFFDVLFNDMYVGDMDAYPDV
jgi:hypothetical protein